jgi:hypothetical protein
MNFPIIIQKKTYLSDPYFFRNESISHKTYIAQPVESIENALRCIDIWISEKYNIGNESTPLKEKKNMAYTLYLYNSNKDIKKRFVGDKTSLKTNVHDFKILQYKKNNVIHTVALLEYDN